MFSSRDFGRKNFYGSPLNLDALPSKKIQLFARYFTGRQNQPRAAHVWNQV